MSNHILSPLIQSEPTDTLYYVSSSLTYLWESINDLNPSELSDDAKGGLCSLIQCISQAVSFEAYRADSSTDAQMLYNRLNPIEKEFIQALLDRCKVGLNENRPKIDRAGQMEI